MPNARLTDVAVKSLKPPPEGQVTYWDETLPSFGVRVSQGGTKSFVLVYGEARTRQTLGRYPIISLADARTEAKRILAELTTGKYYFSIGKIDERDAVAVLSQVRFIDRRRLANKICTLDEDVFRTLSTAVVSASFVN
jgi:mRNA-degrading endonuclease toxin of MazEF toxin-antitoxin module